MLIPAPTAIVDIAEFSSGGGVDAAIKQQETERMLPR